MRAMILAAGRGERMGQLTEHVPKPLIEIAGKTLIVHQVERLRDAGFTEFVINLAYRGEQIRAHLRNGQKFGVNIAYSQEPEGALDTGGGIAAALELLGGEPFTVVNSDVWTDFDFSTLKAPTGAAHLVLVPNPQHNSSGDFCFHDGKIVATGEYRATFAGIGVYRPELFRGPHPSRYPLAPLLHAAARRASVSAELYGGLWLDVGTPERLTIARQIGASHHLVKKPV